MPGPTSESDDYRLRSCLRRLRPHLDWSGIALTGGVAIDRHVRGTRATQPARPLADIDFVAADPLVVSPAATSDFLVSHYHCRSPIIRSS